MSGCSSAGCVTTLDGLATRGPVSLSALLWNYCRRCAPVLVIAIATHDYICVYGQAPSRMESIHRAVTIFDLRITESLQRAVQRDDSNVILVHWLFMYVTVTRDFISRSEGVSPPVSHCATMAQLIKRFSDITCSITL
jgi:hypothetical protein